MIMDFLINLGICAGVSFLASLWVANWMFGRKSQQTPADRRRDVCDTATSERTLASELQVFDL
jgi:hypothetical protein